MLVHVIGRSRLQYGRQLAQPVDTRGTFSPPVAYTDTAGRAETRYSAGVVTGARPISRTITACAEKRGTASAPADTILCASTTIFLR